MSYSPYIPNVEGYEHYFKNQPKEYKRFYTISHTKQLGENLEPIKLVSPTEQTLEQARMSLQRMKEDEKRFTRPNSKRKRNSLPIKKSSRPKKKK